MKSQPKTHFVFRLSLLVLLGGSISSPSYSSQLGQKYEVAKWNGKLDKKKRRTGTWIYATSSVRLIIANYKAGELDGNYQSYYANGKKRQQSSYTTNLMTGKFAIFYNNKNNSNAVRGYYHRGHKSKMWSRWAPDSRLISQVHFDHGLKSGYYTSFVDGKTYQVLHYRQGMLDGLSKTYNPTHNKVIAQGRYVKNVRQGTWRYWVNDGSKLKRVAIFVNGRLNGKLTQYNENGRLWKIWSYKNGIMEGPYKEFFDTKNRIISSSGLYINGKREGTWTSYYKSSKVWKRGPYKNGELHGNYNQYYKSGRLWKTTNYSANKLQGSYTLFSDRNPSVKLLSGQYQNNFRTGKWIYWYPDGKTINKAIYYKKGALNGTTTRYYPSGRKWVKSQYKQNELNGIYIEYYDNMRNSKKLRGLHKNNIPTGKWTYWNSLGKVIKPHKHANKGL